jgi:hypothetical protein
LFVDFIGCREFWSYGIFEIFLIKLDIFYHERHTIDDTRPESIFAEQDAFCHLESTLISIHEIASGLLGLASWNPN